MTSSPRPPLDPEVADAVAAYAAAYPDETLLRSAADLPEARAGWPAPALDDVVLGRRVRHHEESVPGYEGAAIELTVFRPALPGTLRVPGIYLIHGGGMVSGHRHHTAPQAVRLVERFGVVVVTVEYRLAPEFPDPVPVEDCYAGLTWFADHAAQLGVDPDRIAVMGGSAGGGLSAGVALLARDRQGPALLGQVLICPMLDDRDDTVSTRQFPDTGWWDRGENDVGWSSLLGERRGTGDVSPYAAPARAGDLAGLPPTFVDVGSAEVFRDEDVGYASGLWAVGGDAELHVWAGGNHGFDSSFPELAVSRSASRARDDWLERLLSRPASVGEQRLLPRLDPDLRVATDALAALYPDDPPLRTLEDIPVHREGWVVPDPADVLRGRAVTLRDVEVPGFDGATLELSVLAPSLPSTLPRPGIYLIHGGAMVMGHRHHLAAVAAHLVETHGAVVGIVEYRLAPEFPDPVPVEDCYAGLAWFAENARDLGVDARRLVVMGHSAGGGLTAGVTLLARDRGGPAVAAQLIGAAMLDDRVHPVPAARDQGTGPGEALYPEVGWTALLGDRAGGDDVSSYAAPARADLAGLPPTFADTGSADVLRDETVAYASGIWAAGGDAELHVWPGGTHGFDGVFPDLPISRTAARVRDEWLARVLGRPARARG